MHACHHYFEDEWTILVEIYMHELKLVKLTVNLNNKTTRLSLEKKGWDDRIIRTKGVALN